MRTLLPSYLALRRNAGSIKSFHGSLSLRSDDYYVGVGARASQSIKTIYPKNEVGLFCAQYSSLSYEMIENVFW